MFLVDVDKCLRNLEEIDTDLQMVTEGLRAGELEMKVASERINANGKRLKASGIQQKWAEMLGQPLAPEGGDA